MLVNDGKQRWGRLVVQLPAKSRTVLERAELLAKPWSDEETLAACRKQWVMLGLSTEEARALVEIWKDDLMERPGFLVVSAMPRPTFDAMYPLTIVPAPNELVRVGMVFDHLPGEPERLAWVPELEQAMGAWHADFENENFETRKAAAARFAQLGDLAQPFLEQNAKAGGVEAQNRVRGLLEALKPLQVEKLPAHGPGGKPNLIPRVWEQEKEMKKAPQQP